MKEDFYITLQLANIAHAIELGQEALTTARSLQGIATSQEQADAASNEERFSLDTLRYYNFNDVLKQIEWMPIQLKDFKNQMIEIKIANDKMLLEGGFIPCIDKEIADIFLHHTLCRIDSKSAKTIAAIEDALKVLEHLQAELKAM